MKKNTILTAILCIAACAALCVFCIMGISFTTDETANTLINDCIGRGIATVAIAVLVCICGYKNVFTDKCENYKKALVWCLPCLLVTLANFPFSALIKGTASIDRLDILWLFLLDCILIAAMEEILFRGILLSLLTEIFKNRILLAVILESSLFALCHLFNLISGASPAATILQVGYTFLTGLMFSFVFVRTKNIWASLVLHTLFDIGGGIVTTLGSGTFQDTIFWILTAICGAICAIHIIITFFTKKTSGTDEKQ